MWAAPHLPIFTPIQTQHQKQRNKSSDEAPNSVAKLQMSLLLFLVAETWDSHGKNQKGWSLSQNEECHHAVLNDSNGVNTSTSNVIYA